VGWCKENDVPLLSASTPDQAIKFRMSLPVRTGDSCSLSVTGQSSAAASIGPWAWATFQRTRFLIPVRTRSFASAARIRMSCPDCVSEAVAAFVATLASAPYQ
jgi:hypothetical protein